MQRVRPPAPVDWIVNVARNTHVFGFEPSFFVIVALFNWFRKYSVPVQLGKWHVIYRATAPTVTLLEGLFTVLFTFFQAFSGSET